MANPVLEEILRTGLVLDQDGNRHPLYAQISEPEGALLQRLIREHGVTRVLEIGCAQGISALYIGAALAERDAPRRHLILDPYESTFFLGIGKTALRRAGYDFAEIVERPSEYVLPELIAAGEVFDLVFIDGNHEYPYVMMDMLLANRVVRPGGLVIHDDTWMPEVVEVIRVARRHLGYAVVAFVPGSGAPQSDSRGVVRATARAAARLIPRRVARELFGADVLELEPWQAARATMVALQRTVRERSSEEIEHILLVDEWDQKRGVTIRETCQKLGIVPEQLEQWRQRPRAARSGAPWPTAQR